MVLCFVSKAGGWGGGGGIVVEEREALALVLQGDRQKMARRQSTVAW